MGYILPFQPIQSEMYANRMNAGRTNFAYIDRVEKVKLDPEQLGKFNDTLLQEQERLMDENENPSSASNHPPAMKGFIYPDPTNLSPEIAYVVGKGLAVNAYV